MNRPRVVVVGAGIAGLAAGYALRRSGAEVTIVEGARQIGGKLRTSAVAGLLVDEGAEAFVLRTPEAHQLAEAVGLADQLTTPATTAASLVVRGRLRPLPRGTLQGIPGGPEPIRELFGDAAAQRVAEEPFRPGKPLTDDVSVGALIADRLGREIVDGLVDPLLGGVYAGRADDLSVRATMPPLAAGLAEDPSVVRATRRVLDAGNGAAGPMFATVRQGMGAFAAAVAEATGATLHVGLPVREIHRTATGFRVVAGPVPDPTVFEADGVVVAVPATKAAVMLRDVTPWAAHELSQIGYASLAVVTLVYPAAALPAGSGVLVPARERRTVKALTFSSAKWGHLDDGQHTVIRASIGRYGEESVLHRDDADLVSAAVADVAALTGVTAAPLATRVTRWGGALPQYAVGHLDRVRRIREDVSRVPGLALCGAAYAGVGIPACIRTGQEAAARVLADVRGAGEK